MLANVRRSMFKAITYLFDYDQDIINISGPLFTLIISNMFHTVLHVMVAQSIVNQ